MKAQVPADLKEHNRMLVYQLVRSGGAISKSGIARRLGLSVPTVLKIVEYFRGLGILGDAGEGESALGRKPMLMSTQATAAFAVGAEYDGVHLSVGLVDLAGNVLALRRSPAPPDLALLLGGLLADEVEALIRDSGVQSGLVKGLGVGVPGVVHSKELCISQAPLVGINARFNFSTLMSILRDRLGLPVHVANDANAAALGELAARRAGSGGDLIFVELGRGVGAGLVLDGRLREGPGSGAGEIGYMVLDSKAHRVASGPGWLESAMNLPAFWAEVDGGGSPSKESLHRVCHFLALGLSNLCIALDVGNVVLGRAGKESFGPALLECLRQELHSLCPMDISCEFSRAGEPGVTGAAGLALDEWVKAICAA